MYKLSYKFDTKIQISKWLVKRCHIFIENDSQKKCQKRSIVHKSSKRIATPSRTRSCLIKAKFHYTIQVADLVSDLVFDKFVRVCDQLATFMGRKQVADMSR